MENGMEKRRYARKVCLQPCMWSILGGREVHSSRIINHSPRGMLLETDGALPTGIPVKIVRLAESDLFGSSEAACDLGIVRWCARQLGDLGCCHGVGIEIVRRVDGF